MLKSHMDAKEDSLIAISKVPASAGHPLHKGTPREAFIKEFLIDHLPASVSLGAGEIIDASSLPGQPRSQFDIVIYKKNYPKLDFGGGVTCFLIESVVATIEVKSTLTQADMNQAIRAAQYAKSLKPNFVNSFTSGYIPPSVLNFVVSYDGPASIQTVYKWITNMHGTNVPNLSQGEDRFRTPSPSVDGIFVLHKGFIYFDNIPYGFADNQTRAQNPNMKWINCNTKTGNLLLLFMLILNATANVDGRWLDAAPYLKSVKLSNVSFGP